jgi:hypothetical protein
MRKSTKIIAAFAAVVGINASLLCTVFPKKMSESVTNTRAGLNGSFEHIENGLPVNWLVYTPHTVKNADFDILPDTMDPKEGKQSMLFRVRKCAATGGWRSPGLAREIDASPGETYKISVWVKNSGAQFKIKVNAANAFEAAQGQTTISSDQISEWRKLEYTCQIPNRMTRLRMELNVLSPGSFWVDNIEVEKQ